MSEPVEIEFLLKNRTKSGMAEVESGLDSVQQDASKTQAVIATLREEMQRLQQQVAAMPTLDQSNNIAMIEALQAKIGNSNRTFPEYRRPPSRLPHRPRTRPLSLKMQPRLKAPSTA